MVYLSNLQKSPYDSRDYKFVPTTTSLPSKVDLRVHMSPIEDQTTLGSCTANSTTSALELLTKRAGRYEDLSRLFLYYTTREFEGRLGQEGAVLRNAFKMAMQKGVCLESEWDYIVSNVDTKPPQSCYDSAATRLLTRYEAVEISQSNVWDTVARIKSANAQGLPVVIAFAVYDGIFSVSGPLESQNYNVYNRGAYAGNHAVTITGYDDYYGHFVYANSWNTSWGDAGYGALKYGLTTDIFEAWVPYGFDGIEIVPPLLPNQVMTTTIKLPVAAANAQGQLVIPHGTPDLQSKLLRADCYYKDPTWGALWPMTHIYCDGTNLRFENPNAANCQCYASFEYAS